VTRENTDTDTEIYMDNVDMDSLGSCSFETESLDDTDSMANNNNDSHLDFWGGGYGEDFITRYHEFESVHEDEIIKSPQEFDENRRTDVTYMENGINIKKNSFHIMTNSGKSDKDELLVADVRPSIRYVRTYICPSFR
jgi:hypothetical protein